VQEPFRRYDRIAGAVFVALLVIGVITLSVTSPKASTRAAPAVRASTSHAPAPTAAAHTSKPPPPRPRPTATVAPPAPPTHAAPAAPATHAPPPPPPTTPAAPPPPPVTQAAPAGCTPRTNAGNCYEPGEFCRDSDHGATGVAGDGKAIECEDNDGWRWEPV
jgi:hypothetical protein